VKRDVENDCESGSTKSSFNPTQRGGFLPQCIHLMSPLRATPLRTFWLFNPTNRGRIPGRPPPLGSLCHTNPWTQCLLARMFSTTSTVLRTEHEHEYERCCFFWYSYSVPARWDGTRTRTRRFASKMCGTASPLGRVKRKHAVFLLLRMLNGVALRGFRNTFSPTSG
jgi:hypothetical protein